MRLDWTLSAPNLIINIPILLMLLKMYGDWRVIKNRIDLMWASYCSEHKIISARE